LTVVTVKNEERAPFRFAAEKKRTSKKLGHLREGEKSVLSRLVSSQSGPTAMCGRRVLKNHQREVVKVMNWARERRKIVG